MEEGETFRVNRVVALDHPDAVLEGLTITGGSFLGATQTASVNYYGYGVRVGENGGKVLNCRLCGNTVGARQSGGGFAMFSENGVISNCLICANTTITASTPASHVGGYLNAGLVTHCDVFCNTNRAAQKEAAGIGIGAFAAKDKTARVSHCVLTNNCMGQKFGSSVVLSLGGTGHARADNCLVAYNQQPLAAGGFVIGNGVDCIFSNCTVVCNSAQSGCGGVNGSVYKANNKSYYATYYGCVIQDNSSGTIGSENVTVTNGFKCYRTVCPQELWAPANDCVVGSVVFVDPTHGDFHPDFTSPVGIDMCPVSDYGDLTGATDVYGGARLVGTAVDAGCAEYAPSGELTVDVKAEPRQALVGSPFALSAVLPPGTGEGFQYKWTVDGEEGGWVSDAVITNTPTSVGRHTATLLVKTDMGDEKGPVELAFVASPAVAYVRPEADGFAPVWPYVERQTAATNIADAIAACAAGSTVVVLPGLYEVTTQTVVSCAMRVVGEGGASVTEVRNVAKKAADAETRLFTIDDPGAVLEGFTLSNGYLNRSKALFDGSAVFVGYAGGTLASCVITNCTCAYGVRGTIALYGAASVVSNCTVRANVCSSTFSCGSGIYMLDGLVADTLFETNRCTYYYGQGICGQVAYMAKGRVTRCRFVDNCCTGYRTTDTYGTFNLVGGLLDNCLFTGNDCGPEYGGAIYASGGTVLNCTVVGNCGRQGGGIYTTSKSTAVVRNCIVQDSEVTAADAATNVCGGAAFTYLLCPEEVEGEGNRVGVSAFRGKNCKPTRESLAVDHGSVEGYEAYLVGGTDLLSKPRVNRTVGGVPQIDIGAVEGVFNGLSVLVR